jgi:hypothetical protein
MINTFLAAKVGLYFYSTKLFRDKICIINDFCLSLQLHIIKSMTVNAKDLPTNNLNINEIEQNIPPNSLELGRGEERKPSQFVLGKDARLLYQSMLEKIVDAAIRLGIPLSLVAGAPGYGRLFSCYFFGNISDGLVIHASNSGELSWPDIERSHNLLNK